MTVALALPPYRVVEGSGDNAGESGSSSSLQRQASSEIKLADRIKGCLGSIDVVLPDFLAPGQGYTLTVRVESGYIFGVASESARITILNAAAGLSCEESQPYRLMASGRVLQKRWSLPGTVFTVPLHVDGLPWSKFLAARSSIVTALQVDVARLLTVVAPGRSGSVKPLDIDIDFARSGPATFDPTSPPSSSSSSLASAFVSPSDVDGDLFEGRAPGFKLRIPSSNATVLFVSVFFSASEYGSAEQARDAARFATTVVARFVPGFGDAQGLPPSSFPPPSLAQAAPKLNDALPWFVEAASKAARLSSCLDGLDTRAFGVSVAVSLDKGFTSAAATPDASLEKACVSFTASDESKARAAMSA